MIEYLDSLDTYIWPMAVGVAWNFVMTWKLTNEVYGSKLDDTNDGLKVRVEELERSGK